MLSRVAESLFWIGRYVERAENVARLVDAARRMTALPTEPEQVTSNEWASVLTVAGAHQVFGEALDRVDSGAAIDHLIFEPTNPSSVASCLTGARENGRAIRFALTQEVWESLNTAWAEMRSIRNRDSTGSGLSDLVDWIKQKSAIIRGTVQGTMLRGDSYDFLDMGMAVERTDSTARLLDVKYHVLLPSVSEVGRGADHYQWLSLLQAAAAQRAYFAVNKTDITAKGVAEFLILNQRFPRSILFNLRRAERTTGDLQAFYNSGQDYHNAVANLADHIQNQTIDAIVQVGLHEFLTDIIERNYGIANLLGQAYGFAPAIEEDGLTDDRAGQ